MGQVVKKPDANLVPSGTDYVALAIERNLPPEIFAKLLDNAERIDKLRARKAFDAAMSDAKAEMPKILKNREVDFSSQKGRTNYKYEDFAGVAAQVDPVLTKHGLSYRFRTNSDKDHISVTCVVSHRDGHSEENTLTAPNDTSGNKNAIQAIGSTQTYLQRYTLKAALGLAASADDDANAGQGQVANDLVGSDEILNLEKLIKDIGGDRQAELKAATLKYLKVESLAAIPMREYQRAVTALEKKRK